MVINHDLDQMKKLKKFIGKLKPCINCNEINFDVWAKIEYLEAKKCKNCGMISVNPHLTEEGLTKYYQGYLEERTTNENELFEQRWRTYELDRTWLETFIDNGKILDIGCSGGHFLSTFDLKKWNVMGVEIEEEDKKYAMEKYGIPVKVGKITEMEFTEKFDVVMMRGVIEHFSDPITVLKKCNNIINPGGYLFITATPSGDSFAFDVYREKWKLYTPISHIHFFTVNILSNILQKMNFKLVSHHYQYEETPYANPNSDYEKIRNDICLINSGKKEQVTTSVPFLGSIITAIWKKE
jgi:2-polyprenyl-3-methyl-5-hydroxy-6-metoxy-1,4-benzoquinol methylase